MQWSQIKTLLIVSFLILDVYLFVQFLDKKEIADIGVLEHQPSTIEDQLKAEAITFQDLPEKEYEESYISVKQQRFTEEELTELKDVSAQKPFIFSENFIASKLKKPVEVKENYSKDSMTDLFEQIVFHAEEYSFWSWNKDLNVLIFFQDKMGRPVYYNQNGLVLLFLNNKNEVTYYVQTMLGETETLAEKRKLIKPIQAIEKLYPEQLNAGDDITNVNIGFHTRVPFETGVQVFAPIWKVNVNKEKDYFINAIEGFTFSTDEEEFLEEVIESSLDKMKVKREKGSPIEEIINDLKERVE